MGFFTSRRIESLSATRTFGIGVWLRDAQATFPETWSSTLVATALQRVRYSEMLRSARTYVGSETMVGIGDRLGSSSPSELTVRAKGSDLVLLSLGGFGCIGVEYRPVTDWTITVRISEDLSVATIDVVNMTVIGTDVENERVLKNALDAVADILKVGVAIGPCEIPAEGIAGVFGRSDFTPAISVELSMTDLPVIPEVVGAILETQLEAVVGPAERSALAARGQWPLVERCEGGWILRVRDTRSLLWVGGSLYEILQAADSHNDTSMFELAKPPLRALNTTVDSKYVEGVTTVWPEIPSAARLLPMSVRLVSTVHSRSLLHHLAAASSMVGTRWKTSKLPGAKTANFAARASGSDVPGLVLGYGLLPQSPRPVSTYFSDATRPPWWELRFDDTDAGNGYRFVRCEVMTQSHSRGSGLVGSHALIETLNALLDHAQLLDSPPILLVADRDRSWGQAA